MKIIEGLKNNKVLIVSGVIILLILFMIVTCFFCRNVDHEKLFWEKGDNRSADISERVNFIRTSEGSEAIDQEDVPSEFHQDELTVTLQTDNGGRVAWSHQKNIIAFDRMGLDRYFDLWTMDSIGNNENCLSCDISELPLKHVGQPAWYPSGEYIVFQAQKENTPDYTDTKSTPGAGTLNDLWVISLESNEVWRIHRVSDIVSKDSQGVLHPHFSHDGRKLFWSERISGKGTSFGEWILRIADFTIDTNGVPKLSNIKDYNPGEGTSFFESHGFSPDDKHVLFTGTQDGPLEIYEMELSTENITRLTDDAFDVWDEHAHYSPDGQKIIWASSKDLVYTVNPFVLETEFWIMDRNGDNKKKLTYFHQEGHEHYLDFSTVVAADSDWSPDGTHLLGFVITMDPSTKERGKGIIILVNI